MGNAPGSAEVCLPRVFDKLCETVGLPGVGERIWSMAAEMAYTRRIAAEANPTVGDAGRRFNGIRGLTAEGATIDGTEMILWDNTLEEAEDAWGS